MARVFKTPVTVEGAISTNNVISSTQSSGDEGGQIDLAKAATNTTLTTGISLDVFQNKLRIFETGGTNRGYYIDISSGGASVGTNLVSGGGTTTNSLTIGTTGLTTTTGTSPWNGSAAATIDIDTTKVPRLSATNTFSAAQTLSAGLTLSGTTSPLTLNASVGTSGQVLTSAGSGATPTWSNIGYTLISSVAFNGTIPAFSSIPQTYKKLVVQIVFTSMGTFSGSVQLTVNSSATCAYTLYLTGSTTATVNTAATAVPLSNGTPQVSDIHTVEFPNYSGTHPMIYVSGGNSTAQVRWGVASTTAAITQLSFSAGTTWGTAIGNAYLYGVN
jgi:hypothetical protein